MPSANQVRLATNAQGRKIKRNNLIAAGASGAVLTLLAFKLFPHSLISFSLGIAIGLVYANGFEYCLHRFLLHSGRGIFAQHHMVHHTTLNSPEIARYVNFSSNPWGVVALFLVNAAPFLLLGWASNGKWQNGWIVGVFVSFALYYIAFEEVHWRSHMGGWLPRWLRPAARHHLLHHAHDNDRYNVFFPLFDWLIPPRHLQ